MHAAQRLRCTELLARGSVVQLLLCSISEGLLTALRASLPAVLQDKLAALPPADLTALRLCEQALLAAAPL